MKEGTLHEIAVCSGVTSPTLDIGVYSTIKKGCCQRRDGERLRPILDGMGLEVHRGLSVRDVPTGKLAFAHATLGILRHPRGVALHNCSGARAPQRIASVRGI